MCHVRHFTRIAPFSREPHLLPLRKLQRQRRRSCLTGVPRLVRGGAGAWVRAILTPEPSSLIVLRPPSPPKTLVISGARAGRPSHRPGLSAVPTVPAPRLTTDLQPLVLQLECGILGRLPVQSLHKAVPVFPHLFLQGLLLVYKICHSAGRSQSESRQGESITHSSEERGSLRGVGDHVPRLGTLPASQSPPREAAALSCPGTAACGTPSILL